MASTAKPMAAAKSHNEAVDCQPTRVPQESRGARSSYKTDAKPQAAADSQHTTPHTRRQQFAFS